MSSSSRPHRVKSKTFTLHLDSDILEKLTMEAEEQGLSVNVIANRALKKHVEWDAVSKRFRAPYVALLAGGALPHRIAAPDMPRDPAPGAPRAATGGGPLPHPTIRSMASSLVSASSNCSAGTEEGSISTKQR